MKYCFDTCSLLDLGERHYPENIDLFKPIWKFIYNGIDNGTIISVDYVKIELEKKASEWRTSFIKKANCMFLIHQEVEIEYANVIRDIESNNSLNNNMHRKRFMEGADPWLMALARNTKNCTIVSSEQKTLGHYGLLPLCELLGINSMNLVDFLKIIPQK